MKDEMIKSIAKELRILRIENDCSQEELANKSKLAQSSIVRYERGIEDMKLSTLAQMIESYGIDLYIFFERIIAKTQTKEGE